MPAPAPTRAWGWLAGHRSDLPPNGAGTLARVDTEAVFAASARHRRAVADLLESLDENQLAVSSLCAGWDVRTVAAHLASAIAPSNRAFMGAVLRHGGNLHHAIDAVARKTARLPVADIVEILRRHADSRFTPPVTGPRGPSPMYWCTPGTCVSRWGCPTIRSEPMCRPLWSSSAWVVRSGSCRVADLLGCNSSRRTSTGGGAPGRTCAGAASMC